jgi:pimeloyl-ACP methyl ester carboxylesterase
VILFDARGHGKGDKPRQAATYDRQLMVGDVLAVLDA